MRRAVAQDVDADLSTRSLAPLADEDLPYFEHGPTPATDVDEGVTLPPMSGKELMARGASVLEGLIDAKTEVNIHETSGVSFHRPDHSPQVHQPRARREGAHRGACEGIPKPPRLVNRRPHCNYGRLIKSCPEREPGSLMQNGCKWGPHGALRRGCHLEKVVRPPSKTGAQHLASGAYALKGLIKVKTEGNVYDTTQSMIDPVEAEIELVTDPEYTNLEVVETVRRPSDLKLDSPAVKMKDCPHPRDYGKFMEAGEQRDVGSTVPGRWLEASRVPSASRCHH